MEAPELLTPKFKGIEEKNLIDFSLKINEQLYNCSFKEIDGSKIKIIAILSNYPFHIFVNEFNLYDFQNMNRNFRIYDNINELANDLIGYIKENKIRISDIKKNKLTIELNIIAKIDNIVNMTLNLKEDSLGKNKMDFFYKELENKNKEITELKNKINEIEQKRKDDLMIKDKKISDLENRLERLENNLKNININNIDNYQKDNYIERITKILNIKELKTDFKTIKTKKPINEICLFPKSGNYIESSGPKIYDKNHNLIMSFDNIGFCEHICIMNENLVILSQKNVFIFLRIINTKQNIYKFTTFKNSFRNEVIKKIIKGLNEDEIITSDVQGNIVFWKIILKGDELQLDQIQYIETNYNSNTYVLLLKNILIIGVDKLHLYNIENSCIRGITYKDHSFFNIQPLCWNAMIIINENKNLIGVGCIDSTFILEIIDINRINVIKEIKNSSEYSAYDSLCLYQKNFLILGTREGNLYFYDINKNFELIKTMEKIHQVNKNSEASINGIVELSDGAFTSFGEDNKIKIWFF